MKNNLPFINVYEKKSTNSKIVTQILYGEFFKSIKNSKSWMQIKNDADGYKGFIVKKKFPSNIKNTHKVHSIHAELYSKPNVKIKKTLTFGSKISVYERKKNFYKFDNFWIKKKDIKKINYKPRYVFKDIKKFLGAKYKWGGKCYSGLDCSALVQLFFNFSNKFCPRDSKDQIKYFKKKIKLKGIRKNDLIFWKGHVAIAISRVKLIHAYGPFKKTVIMPIHKTILRIEKTANLKVTGIRRIA